MSDTPLPTPASPAPSGEPTRHGGGSILLKWVTGFSLLGSLLVGLTFVVCFRYDQRTVVNGDGTISWHEEGIHRGGWFVSDVTPDRPLTVEARPIIEWVGFGDRASVLWRTGVGGRARQITSGNPLVLMPVILLLITTGLWVRQFFLTWRKRKRTDICRQCGYLKAGLDQPTCPECGASWSALKIGPSSPSPRATRRPGEDTVLALACALFGLFLFGAACELSHPLWIDWLILWPVLVVLCVPLFAVAALARPKTLTLLTLAGAAAWLLLDHANAYAFLLVHWVRSPGVPGSRGLEPETIKALYRYVGGGVLLLVSALTAYGGGSPSRS
ncbi:MAG: hypothetical protein QM783_11195 [Phycisphaerales bacterium]